MMETDTFSVAVDMEVLNHQLATEPGPHPQALQELPTIAVKLTAFNLFKFVAGVKLLAEQLGEK
jgi:hypothetical protein